MISIYNHNQFYGELKKEHEKALASKPQMV